MALQQDRERSHGGRWAGWVGTSVALCGALAIGCSNGDREAKQTKKPVPSATIKPPVPKVLLLPDGSVPVLGGQSALPPVGPVPSEVIAGRHPACSSEMVSVAGRFCIDRWEGNLVDVGSQRPFSPYYPPGPRLARSLFEQWSNPESVAPGATQAINLPNLPSWQLKPGAVPMAVSRAKAIPNGYIDGETAQSACEHAKKRLCRAEEWVTACRGEGNTRFPYGDQYQAGACNVFREAHPAFVLHGNASIGHLDPRLNLVMGQKGPLLRRTGATEKCKSRWGDDAIYDMVGNLDEWVDDANGAFQGGFYARSTKDGCEARITTHPRAYRDYSLGIRCCRDAGRIP